MFDPGSTANTSGFLNTILIALLGGLIGWFSQDMRKRMGNVERRLGATVRALFYIYNNDRRSIPIEAQKALEEALKERK